MSNEISVDIWLRGEHHATTHVIAEGSPAPATWSDNDVVVVLTGMLRALERRQNPESETERPIALRGFSWIVNPFDGGGVVIAIEMQAGAAVAGPFDIAEETLSAMIQRVVDAERAMLASRNDTIH